MMIFTAFGIFAQVAGAEKSFSLVDLELAGLLDLVGLTIAIWTLWSSLWLPLGGNLLRAFRLISLGALAFALSHLMDTLIQNLQLTNLETATLIHHGTVLTAMLFFVPGLASLADALPDFAAPFPTNPQLRLWPFAVGLALTVGALSFILYGFSFEAEFWAFVGLDGSLVLLSGVCVFLVLRARLGGPIGSSLWFALLGLLIFSLAHPLQAWLYEQETYTPGTLGVLHRAVVIPAFCLFAISITNLGQKLSRSKAL
ncbi:MAG TPA: hypothetical protein VH540_00040 [Ktedonobacterales bacterium]|jgi:hypothetical protein